MLIKIVCLGNQGNRHDAIDPKEIEPEYLCTRKVGLR